MDENQNDLDGQTDESADGKIAPRPRIDADKGREPELISSHRGMRMMSRAALVEKVVSAFVQEHGEATSALSDAKTETDRLKLVRDTAQYVLTVESMHLSPDEQADIIRRAYAELFAYGPLDTLFADSRVTTITLEGANRASVRYGHEDLVTLEPLFDDYAHMRVIVGRLLADAGAELRDNEPIIEAGLMVDRHPVCINVVAPPFAPLVTVDIRVHPETPPTLADLVQSGFVDQDSSTFLRALARSKHGFLIVGDTESGKTTLLTALAQLLPETDGVIAVERAGELRLPDGAQRLVVQWPVGDNLGQTFGQQIGAALEKRPGCLVLDEVRADEVEAIALLLARADVPRQIWTFRGPAVAKRLKSALEMVAQRANPSQPRAMVEALYERLPFVINVKRSQGRIQLRAIAEWQSPEGKDYTDYVELMDTGWEGAQLTGKRPQRPLDLADEFWTAR